jgi:hypothetical protein
MHPEARSEGQTHFIYTSKGVFAMSKIKYRQLLMGCLPPLPPLAIMPLAYLFRSTAFYRRGVMPWGSSAIACLALVWFVQRAVL